MSSETPAPGADNSEDKDRTNLKSVATVHFVALMGAVTLWGAADSWAAVSGWGVARVVAVVNAIIAGTVVAGIVHEWGHYAGARLSGSVTQVFAKPAGYFFMFNFPFDQNDRRQFLWMSWGGILAPWAVVLSTLLLVPVDNPSRAMLLAVLVTRAAQAGFFEVPVAMRTAGGGEPQKELERRLLAGGLKTARYAGIALGVVTYVAA